MVFEKAFYAAGDDGSHALSLPNVDAQVSLGFCGQCDCFVPICHFNLWTHARKRDVYGGRPSIDLSSQ